MTPKDIFWCRALVIAWLLVISVLISGKRQPRLTASGYIATACQAFTAIYEPLVASSLSQFQDGFSTADLLEAPKSYNTSRLQDFRTMSLLYIIDGQLWIDGSLPQPGGKRLKNLEYFGIPLLQQLSQVAGMWLAYGPSHAFTLLESMPTFCPFLAHYDRLQGKIDYGGLGLSLKG